MTIGYIDYKSMRIVLLRALYDGASQLLLQCVTELLTCHETQVNTLRLNFSQTHWHSTCTTTT